MSMPEQKTEAATPRRRQEARRQGMMLQAPGVSRAVSVAGLAMIAIWFAAAGGAIYQQIILRLSGAAGASVPIPTVSWAAEALRGTLLSTFEPIAPALAIAFVLTLLGPVLQHGFSVQPLRLDFSRLDPVRGFTRLISRRSLVETIVSVIMLVVMTSLGALIWWGVVRGLLGYMIPLGPLLSEAWSGARGLILALSAVALGAGALDWLVGRQQYEQDIRMTRQELREEMRRSEGDPLVRARLRSLQRRAARMRMLSRVREADVVITNPTHFAIALKYDETHMRAPEVIAKGRGFVAERIREEARLHGVPIMENQPLAQALHRSVEVGHPIPPELFRAVAEVLAAVYRQQGRTPGGERP